MTALAGWRSFRLASSPGDPPRVLVGTSPEGREVSLGEVLDHGHGVWSCVLLGPDGEVLMEEDCLSERRGLEKLYGWSSYLSGGGSWEASSRERAIGTVPGGAVAASRPHGEEVGRPAPATETVGSNPAPGTSSDDWEECEICGGSGLVDDEEDCVHCGGDGGFGLDGAEGVAEKQPSGPDLTPTVGAADPIAQAPEPGPDTGVEGADEGAPAPPAPPARRLRHNGPEARPATTEVGKRLQDARLARGWTQADLARRVRSRGWPSVQAAISALERGVLSSSHFTPRIEAVLGISLGAPSRSEVCGQREAVGELGQRLRAAREAKRLSLSAVAARVVAEGAGAQETVRATLCSLERGRLKTSVYLPAILRVLGLEAE